MATITQATATRNLVESHRRVRSPLERLRGYIRTYVSLEGAAVLGLYLALWFWIGLLLDYGVFKAFGLDWVQALNWWVRVGFLTALLAGLLTAVSLAVLTRLFREFRDPALALVLERRFPRVLGDRLITAVELSDPRQAAALGYSAAMVEQTIHEAAARVETVPVKEVFNWRRLVVRGITVVVLTLFLYLLVGAGFCLVNAVRAPGTASVGFRDFHEVATIWGERNLLMMNTIWPRKAHLELIGWPESGELRMGKGEQPPSIRVRALKYVVAGAPSAEAVRAYESWLEKRGISDDEVAAYVQNFRWQPPEGWRPVSWFDLTPALLGQEPPSVAMPVDWEPRDVSTGLTIDEIELRLDREETHATLSPDAQEGLRNVIALVKERAAHPSMRRILRELEVPETATLSYRGNSSSSQSTLQKVADNEYTGQFGDLREDVTFTVQGLDYYTANRYVKVVDPPALESLERQEDRPAYLYYRVGRNVKALDLRGKKQHFDRAVVSLQGGEVIRIDVPLGTNLMLEARATKDLQSIAMEPHKPGTLIQGNLPTLLEDGRTFQTRFPDVRQEQRFFFRFVDSDGVRGQRQVLILPTEDAPPKIREFGPDEVIRKVRGGYMVSVSARIPFVGKVDDDYGLSGVHYAYTLNRLESGVRFSMPEVLAVGTLPLVCPMGQGALPGMTYLAGALDVAARQKQEATAKASKVAERYALPRFDRLLEDQPEELLPLERVQALLSQAQKEPYRQLVRSLDIKPDVWRDPELEPASCDFPLAKKQLKVAEGRAQPRYQLELWLEAADTDLDGETDRQGEPRPHIKLGDEKFVFIIVSENELLAEVAKDEEKLSADMEGTYGKLLEAQEKLVQVTVDLSTPRVKAEELGPMSVRAEQVSEVLEKSQASVRDIAAAYARILRELRTNQVDRKMIARVESSLVKPLGEVDGVFDTARESVGAFRTALDKPAELAARVKDAREAGVKARADLQELMVRLQNIMAAMQKMTDINKLVKMVVEIEKQEQEQFELLQKIQKALEDDEINKLLKGDKSSEKTEPEKKKP